jgi:hypothetical protein
VCCGGSVGSYGPRSAVPGGGRPGGGSGYQGRGTWTGSFGRCVPREDLCGGECCAEGERCARSSRSPEERICCAASSLCSGVCCPEGERCEGGRCVRVQQDCEPPCGPDRSCCSGFECCECCTGPGYTCGRKEVQPYKGARGEEIWICQPVEPPAPAP